jgi:hypothetical protein
LERRQLRPRPIEPIRPDLEHIPRTRLSEYKAANKQAATETEVLAIAVLMVRGDADVAGWAKQTLDSQDLAEQEAGDQWAPPYNHPLWNASGDLLNRLELAMLCTESEAHTIADVLAVWLGPGGTEGLLPASDLWRWTQSCREGRLFGRQRASGRSAGSRRHIGAAVRVARLLRDEGVALKAAHTQAAALARTPPQEKKTKAWLIESHGNTVCMLEATHELDMAELRESHHIEISNLREVECGLDALLDSLTKRAAKAAIRLKTVQR